MFIIQLKRLKNKIKEIIATALSILGALVTIGEAVNEIFGYQGLFLIYRDNVIIVVILVIASSIGINWDKLKFSARAVGYPDVSITLQVCDALKQKGAIIIPTNSTFDTMMKDDFISIKSLQGQYQVKYYKDCLQELDLLIEDGLKNKRFVTIKDGRSTKTKRYSIGTVCKISGDNVKKRAYFVADSNINKNGIPENVDVSDITKALVGIWDSLIENGNMEEYSIPLFGTGRAGANNASRDDIVKEIVNSFLVASREHKITENLRICILPEDFKKISWDDLCEYTKYQCTFFAANVNNEKIGRKEITPNIIVLESEDIDYDFGDMDEENDKNNIERILEILTNNELRINEIAEAVGISIRSTTVFLKTLIEKGQVKPVGNGRIRKYTCILDTEK